MKVPRFLKYLSIKVEQSHLQTILSLFVFSICLYIISATTSASISHFFEKKTEWTSLINSSILTKVLYIVVILTFGWVAFLIISKNFIETNKSSSNLRKNKSKYYFGIFLAALIIIGSALCVVILFLFFPHKIYSVLYMLGTNPGGIFVFITGVFTLIGTIIAIQSIQEYKHIITTYPQLIDNLINLIDKSEEHDVIKIVSYFVLPGFWQIKNKEKKDKLDELLRNRRKNIQVICLNENEHMKMLLTIAELKNRNGESKTWKDVRELQDKSIRILHSCAGSEYSKADYSDSIKEKKNAKCISQPKTMSFINMPPYYFFVSDNRAIIVTPVGLPRPIESESINTKSKKISDIINNIVIRKKGEDEVKDELKVLIESEIGKETEVKNIKQISEVQNAKRGSGGDVETLGFETTDRSIIRDLQNVFDKLYDSDNAKLFIKK